MNIFLINLKVKIKKNLILLGLFYALFGYTQHSNSEQIYTNGKGLTSIDLRSKELVGTSYFEETFLPAKLSNNEVIQLVRYNAYLDEMEVEIRGKAYYLPKSINYSISFEGSNQVYQLFNFDENGSSKSGFFLVLNEGDKASLIVKEKIKLYDEVPAKLGFTKYEPPTLKRAKDEFFIHFANNKVIKLPKKKKDFLTLFSKKSKELDLFAKKNKIGFKKTEDLIKIISYYNAMN